MNNNNSQIKSVSYHNIICSKASYINGVFVIGLTFVISCILLSCRINFHFAFNSIVSDSPFMHLFK